MFRIQMVFESVDAALNAVSSAGGQPAEQGVTRMEVVSITVCTSVGHLVLDKLFTS